MRAEPLAAAAALVAAMLLSPPLARAEAAASGDAVRVTVMAVRAIPAGEGVQPGMGAGLDELEAKLKRLPFARYELVSTASQDVRASEPFTVPFGSGGRFVVTAVARDGSFQLGIREHAPGAGEPCLSSEARVEAGKAHITFCDGVPEKAATFVFITKVQAAR